MQKQSQNICQNPRTSKSCLISAQHQYTISDQVNLQNVPLLVLCPGLPLCISVNLFMNYLPSCSEVYFCHYYIPNTQFSIIFAKVKMAWARYDRAGKLAFCP